MGKSLRFLKGQLTRAEARAKVANDLNLYSLKHYLDELEKDYKEFETFFDDRDLSEIEEQEYIEYHEKHATAQSMIKEAIDKKLNRDPGDSFDHSSSDPAMANLFDKQGELLDVVNNLVKHMPAHEARLPTLKIPMFSGDYRQWSSFKNLFQSRIGTNPRLSNVEKLGHLVTLLSGEASGLVKHLQLEDENYESAWEALEHRYERPYRIGLDIISNFKKSIENEIKMRNVSEFCNSFTETFLSLDNLSPYSQKRDIWVLHFIVERFDRFLKERWALHISGNKEPSLEDMKDFLNEFSDLSMDKDDRPKRDIIEKSKFQKKDSFVKSGATFLGTCFVCKADHKIFNCNKFKELSVSERDKMVKSLNRCFNCLGSGHSVKLCKSSHRCSRCNKRHHSLLHVDGRAEYVVKEGANSVTPNLSLPEETGLTRIHCQLRKGVRSALLPTALVSVLRDDQSFLARIMLDSGAQASFATESLVRKMNLRVFRHQVPIQVMASDRAIYSNGYVNLILASKYNLEVRCPIVAHVLENLTGPLPESNLNLKHGRSLYDKFQLADPRFEESSEVDMIVGADHFFGIIGPGKYYQSYDNLYIIGSMFGWLIAGGAASHEEPRLNTMHAAVENTTFEKMIERFWDIEDSSEHRCESEVFCEQLYRETTIRESTGRYSVNLPIKDPKPILGKSYHLALRRFHNLEKKLRDDSDLGIEYKRLIDSFVSLGYLEQVSAGPSNHPIIEHFYLPHYAVVTGESANRKIRVVFDASMRSDNGVALNDVLHTGPNLQMNLLNLLTEFSFYEFVFSTDIKKMYRQIKINQCCRDYQRIFWRDNQDEDVRTYRLTTVTDGMSCSPFLALRTLDQLITDEGELYPLGAEAMSQRYMDDFFVGDANLSRLLEKKNQLIGILNRGGMSLSKWASNCPEITSSLDDKSSVAFHDSSMVKTLGVLWNTSGDYFSFCLSVRENNVLTKRSLLSESARVFDPAGWIAPVTVLIKKLFQTTWIKRTEWDETLPDEVRSDWAKIRSEISALNEVKLPRWIGEGDVVNLHGFCDASLHAYAAVIYSKVVSSEGIVVTRLLCSKTKVAPLKPLSIARLELCAAHLLAKLFKSILPSFQGKEISVRCWSDSTTVLAWLRSSPSRWVSFVANRCGSIHELLPNVAWGYIKSTSNAADVASRGIYPRELVFRREWWLGPCWLAEFDESSSTTMDFTTVEEQKRHVNASTAICPTFIESFISRFSSLNRLRRTFAYMKRAVTRSKPRYRGELTAKEVEESFVQLMKIWQKSTYGKEIDCVRRGENVSISSRIVRLFPILDDVELLRVGGRLGNSQLTFEQKHPILLSKGHLVDLIIDFIHFKYYHAGCRLIMSIFRSKFYVSGLRPMIKNRIRICQVCLRFRGKTYEPLMGQLPSYRFANEKPFYHCGVDFCGLLNVRPYKGKGRITIKVYISIFVCLISRAVHLEVVLGLDTGSLILALKRFISRRGHCSNLYSDNGKNFVGCAKHLTKLKHDVMAIIEDRDMQQFLCNGIMQWSFIPPQSPTFGGIWEAGVKSVKYHLYRALEGQVPTLEELMTFLSDIECVLNSRPISNMSDDPSDFDLITPAHLINGYPLVHVPLCGFEDKVDSSCEYVHRYQNLRKALNSFWRCWRNEFYNEQLKMSKWFRKGREPQLNDFVLIRRKNDPPTCWSRGKIIKLYEGKDQKCRVVDVSTSRGVSREMIRNLVPLTLKRDASTGGKM